MIAETRGRAVDIFGSRLLERCCSRCRVDRRAGGHLLKPYPEDRKLGEGFVEKVSECYASFSHGEMLNTAGAYRIVWSTRG